MFSPQFAQALTAINSLTTKLSSSVFNAVAGNNHNSGGPHGAGNAPGGYDAGETASMMSVPLEESFSV